MVLQLKQQARERNHNSLGQIVIGPRRPISTQEGHQLKFVKLSRRRAAGSRRIAPVKKVADWEKNQLKQGAAIDQGLLAPSPYLELWKKEGKTRISPEKSLLNTLGEMRRLYTIP